MPLSVFGMALMPSHKLETSTRNQTAAKSRAQFARGTFGLGAVISKKAFSIAQELVTA